MEFFGLFQRYPTDRAYFIAKEILMTERTYKKDLEVLNLVSLTYFLHIFSDSPQFQHTAPQFSQAVLSLCVCVVLPPLSLYSAQQHRKRAAAYARVEGLCIYIFGIAVLLF